MVAAISCLLGDDKDEEMALGRHVEVRGICTSLVSISRCGVVSLFFIVRILSWFLTMVGKCLFFGRRFFAFVWSNGFTF